MPGYNINILGLDLNFRTDAGQERVDRAAELLEERFAELEKRGTNLSKEKILVFLLLSLADDYLQSEQRHGDLEKQVRDLLGKIDKLKAPN
ncbi:MAG: cell division protein ZapA [Desulfonatronovibrionaceae bacterium]